MEKVKTRGIHGEGVCVVWKEDNEERRRRI
jgi:hypothetical protein